MKSLARQLDDYWAGLKERADPATLQVLLAESDHLLAERVAERALQVGDPAPDFTLPDQSGRPVSLSATLARGPVVLIFFRGGWCPFCTLTLRAYAKIHPALRRQDAEVLAVSPQKTRQCAATSECSALPFPLLSDHDNQLARRYGVVVPMSPALQDVYRRFGHDVPAINGVPRWDLPMPAGYVIGSDGRVVLAQIDPRTHRRLEPVEALAAVERLAQPAG